MNDYVEAARLPPEQQGEAISRLDKRVRQAKVDYDVVIALLVPALTKVSEASRRNQAYLRAAIVAVAAKHYRRDKGHWPGTVDELAQGYLKAVPTDPYDGKPLHYKPLPDGVIVYSVGPEWRGQRQHRNRTTPRQGDRLRVPPVGRGRAAAARRRGAAGAAGIAGAAPVAASGSLAGFCKPASEPLAAAGAAEQPQ